MTDYSFGVLYFCTEEWHSKTIEVLYNFKLCRSLSLSACLLAYSANPKWRNRFFFFKFLHLELRIYRQSAENLLKLPSLWGGQLMDFNMQWWWGLKALLSIWITTCEYSWLFHIPRCYDGRKLLLFTFFLDWYMLNWSLDCTKSRTSEQYKGKPKISPEDTLLIRIKICPITYIQFHIYLTILRVCKPGN